MKESFVNPCMSIRRRDPYDMSLAEIDRELAVYDKLPQDQRTPRMIDRINELERAQRQVRTGKSLLWR